MGMELRVNRHPFHQALCDGRMRRRLIWESNVSRWVRAPSMDACCGARPSHHRPTVR